MVSLMPPLELSMALALLMPLALAQSMEMLAAVSTRSEALVVVGAEANVLMPPIETAGGVIYAVDTVLLT